MIVTTDPVRAYLDQIGRTALLTAQQEVDLGERMAAGRQARQLLDGATGHTDADRRELRRLVADGRSAKNHMIEANLRLVVSIAKRYAAGGGLPLPDLVQEGTIGMMRAVDKFDHQRGIKFSTYATWWIKQAIGRALAAQGRTIRLPDHMVTVLTRVNHARREALSERGREPTAAELAAKLDLPMDKVDLALRHAKDPVSLDTPIGEEGDGELSDLIADEGPDPAVEVAEATVRQSLEDVLATLSEREASVLAKRFGLDDGEPRTLDDVGTDFGVSRERIRQIEAKALSKLRHPGRAVKLAALLS